MDNSAKKWWHQPWVWIVTVPAVIVAIVTATHDPATQDTAAATTGIAIQTDIPAATTTFSAPTTTVAPVADLPSTTVAAPPVTAGQPQAPAARTAGLCDAPPNPMGYNYCGNGSLITDPDPTTCSYFRCIGNWANGKGYLEECRDGMVSMSGGRRGSCSGHGGDESAVYS